MIYLIAHLTILSFGLLYTYNSLRQSHKRVNSLQHSLLLASKNMTALSKSLTIAEAVSYGLQDREKLLCLSQHGEEFYLWEAMNFKSLGVFVEVGAYNGKDLSNSYFFETIGWKCILIEAHPELAEQCKSNRISSSTITVHAAVSDSDTGTVQFSMVRGPNGVDTLSFVETPDYHLKRIISEGGILEKVYVPTRTLESILDEVGVTHVDCLSIDVEGGELKALKGANLSKIKPRVIMIEDNSGGKNAELNQFICTLGYRKINMIGCNVIYLINE